VFLKEMGLCYFMAATIYRHGLQNVVDPPLFWHYYSVDIPFMQDSMKALIEESSGMELLDDFFEAPFDYAIQSIDTMALALLKIFQIPDNPIVYVDKFYVHPDMKGQGYGEKLANEVMKYSIEKFGQVSVALRFRDENQEAKSFFLGKWFNKEDSSWIKQTYKEKNIQIQSDQLVIRDGHRKNREPHYWVPAVGVEPGAYNSVFSYLTTMHPSSFKSAPQKPQSFN
jgi:ribosomal protein S18 acetylase RimI-like enzyme